MKKQCFSYAKLRKASCPVIIKYLTFYLFIWLAELAFLAFLVGLYCCFFVYVTFFFFLKETRPPCKRIIILPRAPTPNQETNQPVVSLPEPSLLWAPAKSLQDRELVSVGQDFSGKRGSLFQRAQITLQWL